MITDACTGTFEFESASRVYTELQCRSYVFVDADYGRNLDRGGAPTKAFDRRKGGGEMTSAAWLRDEPFRFGGRFGVRIY